MRCVGQGEVNQYIVLLSIEIDLITDAWIDLSAVFFLLRMFNGSC